MEFNCFFFSFVCLFEEFVISGRREKLRLVPDFTCGEEMSQHTSCHRNSEEHETELAAGLHPNIIPVVTRGSCWRPVLLGMGS